MIEETLVRGAELSESKEDGLRDGLRSDRWGEPDTGLAAQQVTQAFGGGSGDDGKLRGGCFEERVGHAFVARGKNEECGLGVVAGKIGSKAGKADGVIDAEIAGKVLQTELERTVAEDGERGGGMGRKDFCKGMQEQVDAFLVREAAHAEKTGRGKRLCCGTLARGLRGFADGSDVDRIGVDGELMAGNREMLREVVGHGLGLAENFAGMRVQRAIGEAMQARRGRC